jgi:hypothetical protein
MSLRSSGLLSAILAMALAPPSWVAVALAVT